MENASVPFSSFWISRASGYHGSNEAATAPLILFRRVALRRGTFGRTYGVRAVDVQRSRPVPGEPPDQRPLVPDGDGPQAGRRLPHGSRRRKSEIETGGDFPAASARETGSSREGRESVKSGQRQGSHQSHARRHGEQVGRRQLLAQ